MGIKVHAQLDPTLTGMVLIYTEKAKKTLKNQEKVMLLQTTGHIWTKEEVEAVTDLQREFNAIWIRSVRLSAMPPRYTASTTR